MKIINPATEEIIGELEPDTLKVLSNKFEALQSSQPDWMEISLSERKKIITRFSDLIGLNIESLAATLTNESGKPLSQSRNEIKGAINRITWLLQNAEKNLSAEIMTEENGLEEKITYEPLGVICNISAWNYPYLVGVNIIIPALLAGNTIMYKPSEYAILTGIEIEKLLKASGILKDVFHLAIGGKDVGELLLGLSFDGYFFTGSYKTGKYIFEKVASKMVPCQCELGGKDPLYVTDDIEDIRSVAVGTADGAFYNNGQSCCAVERIYVHQKVYDEYCEAFVEQVKSWKVGSPEEEENYFGPVTRKEQLIVLENQVNDALKKGAKIITGGKRINRTGYYFEPTVLIDVNHDMLVMREETFGPVIGIMKVKDDEEAVRLMGDSDYGLTSAVYSSDKTRAENILKRINSASGYWNCCDRVSAPLPWSGRKNSGFGVTLSNAGLRAFVQPKAWHLKS
jgi:acyl-CoA reductase-like NAD-dependent aldehyde dehydrogenase